MAPSTSTLVESERSKLHALVAELAEAVDVGRLAVDRGRIELEIPGVDHEILAGAHRHAASIDDAVGHAQRLDQKTAELERRARRDPLDDGVARVRVLVELLLEQRGRELGRENGDVDFRQHVGQRTDVVLVAVRDDEALQAIAELLEIRDVGDHAVDPHHVVFGEHHAAVDDHRIVTVLDAPCS